MQEINMGGFENQKIDVVFAGKRYEIELDAPAEIYRQFFGLNRSPKTEEDWDKIKEWIAEFIGFYNKIDKEKFAKSIPKIAVINFINAYGTFLKGTSEDGADSKKVVKGKTKKAG
jgi:hypothetical protein